MKEDIGKDMATGEHISDMLTIREVARLLHVHPNTLRRWSNNGRLRPYRINSRGDRRYKREEIAQFLDELNGHGNGDQEAPSMQRSH
jgi:excisionase family DNA binding protein